jgi:sugar phosphate permease
MKFRNRVLGFLFFFSALTYVNRLCIAVVGPEMQRDLGLTSGQWGWVLGVFAISYGLFGVPTGLLCDRMGPRRFVAITTVCLSCFTALTGMVAGFWQVLSARFVFGAAGAGAFPSCAATNSRWFPLTERARAQGVVLMASRFGGGITPLVVVFIQRRYGWHAAFLILGAIGILWAPFWYLYIRDNPADKKGISAAEIEEIHPTLQRRAQAKDSFSWREALARPNLWWIMLMYYTYCWSAYFYLSWLWTFLEKGRGYDKANISSLSWLPFAFGAVANILGGLCSDSLVKRVGLKWGRRGVGLIGLGLSTLFIGVTMLTQDKLLTVLWLSLGFAASDFMNPTAWAVCMDIGGRRAGAVSGAMNMAGQMGSFSSAVAFGYIVDATHSYDSPLIPITVLTAVSTLVWLKIDPTVPLIREMAAPPEPGMAAGGLAAPEATS